MSEWLPCSELVTCPGCIPAARLVLTGIELSCKPDWKEVVVKRKLTGLKLAEIVLFSIIQIFHSKEVLTYCCHPIMSFMLCCVNAISKTLSRRALPFAGVKLQMFNIGVIPNKMLKLTMFHYKL